MNHQASLPNYITASSPQGLRRLMFQTNARIGGMIEYFDIQQYTENGKQKWIAWYYTKLKDLSELEGEG